MFHLERYRDTKGDFSIIPEKYETDGIDRILQIEREKSMDFLRSALSE